MARSGLARFNVKAVTDVFDIISLTAFEELHLRRAALTHDSFTHFLPPFIDAEHASRARPHILHHIALAASDSGEAFTPTMALRVIPAAMNQVLITMLSGQVHTSTRAVETYLALQRLLVYVCDEFSDLRADIGRLLEGFAASEAERTKGVVPSLGELLVLLSVAPQHSWHMIARSFLSEFLTRNTLWALQAHPELLDPALPTADRLSLTFEANLTAMRLLMFHVHLLTSAPWESVGRSGASTVTVSAEDIEALRLRVRELGFVNTWGGFLAAVGVSANAEELADLLVYALRRSAALGYHVPRPLGAKSEGGEAVQAKGEGGDPADDDAR